MSDLFLFFRSIFDTTGFPPRWYCGSAWTTALGAVHIISDLLIFIAYISIPICIFIFSKKQENLFNKTIPLLFIAFITLCGFVHLIDTTLFWYPWYRFSGLIKALTALASVATSLFLAINIKKILNIPKDLELKRYLEHLIETVPHSLLIVDKEGTIKFCNQQTCTYSGYSADELMNQSCRIFFPEMAPPEALESLHNALKERNKTLHNIKFKTKEGEVKEIDVYLSLIAYNDSNDVLLSLEDLEQKKELEKTTQKMHAVLNSVVDGIITIDEKGIIQSFNPAAETLFAYRAEEVIGQSINILMAPTDLKGDDWFHNNYINLKDDSMKDINRESTARTKNGSIFPIELGMSEFTVHNQRTFVGIFRNISERKRNQNDLIQYAHSMENTNRALAEAKAEAEKANTLKSEFLSSMSHELRTPMHAILSFAALGIKRIEDTETKMPAHFLRENEPVLSDKKGQGNGQDEGALEEIKPYFSKITIAGDRLLGLLNNLLDLAKLEAGKTEFRLEENNFHEVLNTTLMELELLFSQKNLKYSVDHKTTNSLAVFDKEKIVQVLVNLISNAIKFSPEGSTISISVEDSKEGSGLLCRVEDEGVGIPPEELEYVFEKFIQSSHTKTQAGGTGLGLAICKQIIDAHGGLIWVENRKNGGAVFQFILPFLQSSNSGKSSDQPSI